MTDLCFHCIHSEVNKPYALSCFLHADVPDACLWYSFSMHSLSDRLNAGKRPSMNTHITML